MRLARFSDRKDWTILEKNGHEEACISMRMKIKSLFRLANEVNSLHNFLLVKNFLGEMCSISLCAVLVPPLLKESAKADGQ